MVISVQPQPLVAHWLHAEMQIACFDIREYDSPQEVSPGELYVGIVINECNTEQPVTYHRAVVCSTRKTGLCTMVEVLFVDSGEIDILPQFQLKNIPRCHIDYNKIRPQVCSQI